FPRRARRRSSNSQRAKSPTAPCPTRCSTSRRRPARRCKRSNRGRANRAAVQVLEAKAGKSSREGSETDSLPKVQLPGGVSASELRTALGTVLTFVREGRRYVVAGFVEPPAVEAIAKGL